MFFKNKEDIYIPQVSKLERKEIERLFTRVFKTEEGQKVLAYLQFITFHRALTFNADESQLRHQEGERALVSKILKLINS